MAKEIRILQECMSESGVTEQDLADLKSGKTKPEEAKDNVKCATQCLLVKSGFMDDKGTVMTKKILSEYTDAGLKAKMEKGLATCANTKGANPCDTAFQITVCMTKEAGDMMP